MNEKLKDLGYGILGYALLLGMALLLVVFVKGAVWAAENVLPVLIGIGWLVLAVNVVIMLPLSLLRRVRGVTGSAIFYSSFLYGLICWLTGCLVTYILWGTAALVVGLLLLGGGVVPMGMVAAIFKGEWGTFLTLGGLLILTFGARILGVFIMERAE